MYHRVQCCVCVPSLSFNVMAHQAITERSYSALFVGPLSFVCTSFTRHMGGAAALPYPPQWRWSMPDRRQDSSMLYYRLDDFAAFKLKPTITVKGRILIGDYTALSP